MLKKMMKKEQIDYRLTIKLCSLLGSKIQNDIRIMKSSEKSWKARNFQSK